MTGQRELRQGFAERKVKGGKLVRVRLIHDGEMIRSVRITGDFLLHPEETLVDIEMGLFGIPLDGGRDFFLEVVNGIAAERNAQFIGFSAEDIADLLEEALI
ncbi:MAG TPA: hypothetical protein VMW26_01650 [Methanomassiliicoccales archaeon]|nr:hypothetical protein [Methanomassiliicoccales archaeon]